MGLPIDRLSSRLPRRFPVGAKYVVEGYGGEEGCSRTFTTVRANSTSPPILEEWWATTVLMPKAESTTRNSVSRINCTSAPGRPHIEAIEKL